MRPCWLMVVISGAVFCVTVGRAQRADSERRLTLAALDDKVRGGWAGQMIGVSFGAPTEFRFNARTIDGELPAWKPENVSNALNQDDLYVDMTFAEVMDRLGLDATCEQYGEAFRDTKYNLWHANAAARRLLNLGVKAPQSGHPQRNIHANDIDFQIESDFIGLMCPGLPRESNKYCDRVGRVMNYGDGLYGGMFVCGMYAAAFFEPPTPVGVRRVVEAGLACIPRDSGYGRIVRDTLDWSAQHPTDWKRCWQLLEDKWDRDDPCPGGALEAFNIDARLNGAYIALGLLYGGGDFARTLEVTTRCGQDSDCNPSNAVGILGTMLGYEQIPELWKGGIPALGDRKFAFTNYSFNEICASTAARARKVVSSVGGRVTPSELIIPMQTPRAPRLEQWDMGVPEKVVSPQDAQWTWKGAWTEAPGRIDRRQFTGKVADGAGAEAVLTFTGTAVAIVGRHGQDGGRAEVHRDGRPITTMDSYIVERTTDTGLWHAYGLKPGPHTVRVVTRDDADPRSRGKKTAIYAAITFR